MATRSFLDEHRNVVLGRRYVSPAQIAELLGISRRAAYRLVQSLPRVHIGRLVRVDERDLEAYLKQHTVRAWSATEPLTSGASKSSTIVPAADYDAPNKPSWLRPLLRGPRRPKP